MHWCTLKEQCSFNLNIKNLRFFICTIYNFFQKLVKTCVIYNTYQENINLYLNKLDKIPNYNKTDTTFVCNKLGEDSASFNPQVKKHETKHLRYQ